ncbi:MAG: hypothetical protein HRT83_03670 [Hyphomicrobiaceae bacterium]|nr:hypothetical protein [Hyphomicrobiaceae bacterium]
MCKLANQAKMVTKPSRVAEIQLHLNNVNTRTAAERTAQILAGLSFDRSVLYKAYSTFSGVWRIRIALVAILYLELES